MDKKVIIDGHIFQMAERLPSLTGNGWFVLCVDDLGRQSVCTEEIWNGLVQPMEAPPAVHTGSTPQEKIALFLSLFRGRSDVFARRYFSPKTEKSGYVPACENEWIPGLCDKKIHRCSECPNRAFFPLSEKIVRSHLIGKDPFCRDVVGIYPILEDHRTWLLAADFDEESWQEDVSAFRETCLSVGISPAVERSRSGCGAHVWFFFSEPVPAVAARQLGSRLLTETMSRRHELSFRSYDRLFPSQDFIPSGGFGNLIALPFQGQAQQKGNTLFVDEQFRPYHDQWAFLSTLPKITPAELVEYLAKMGNTSNLGMRMDGKTNPWPSKALSKTLTQDDFPKQARLMISNLIFLDKTGFSQAALNQIKRLGAFSNPVFYRKQAMRLRLGKTPCVIDCGWEDETFLGLPRGCSHTLLEMLAEQKVPYTLEDQRCRGHVIDVSFCGTLRAEQIPAAAALLEHETGVLSAATAFGKTVVGAYLIGQRKVNTLILVHSAALLEQWKTSLTQFLEIREVFPNPPKKRGRQKHLELIGQLGSGKNTRGGIVDIAIMQSLFSGEEKEVKPFVAEYGMVLCDECHHLAAFTFEKILREVRAVYVYGLSATPVRQDGHQPIIFMQCGPIRYCVDAKSQAEKRTFSHFVIPRFTRTRLPFVNRIQDIYTGIIKDESRNQLILSDAFTLLGEGRTPLILTERKEHAIQLAEKLNGKADHVFLLLGSGGQREKQQKLSALHRIPAGETLVIVATGKYIGEGFDEPRLDTILLTMPISWKGTLAQYAGRLHRNYDGKNEVRIYDYVDIYIPVLERMYHKRRKGYSELGYQIKASERDNTVSQVYNGQDYLQPFTTDLTEAVKSICIVSPVLARPRVQAALPVLEKARSSGVQVVVYTRSSAKGSVALLQKYGVTVKIQNTLEQRFAVIDQRIVWYGTIDYLSSARKEKNTLRFEGAEVAGELLDLLCSSESPIQLSFE